MCLVLMANPIINCFFSFFYKYRLRHYLPSGTGTIEKKSIWHRYRKNPNDTQTYCLHRIIITWNYVFKHDCDFILWVCAWLFTSLPAPLAIKGSALNRQDVRLTSHRSRPVMREIDYSDHWMVNRCISKNNWTFQLGLGKLKSYYCVNALID